MTCHGWAFLSDVINHNAWLAEQYGCCLCWPAFISFRGRMWSLVVSFDRTHVPETVQCCLTFRTRFLVAGVIKEVVSWLWEEPVIAELATLSTKPFQLNFELILSLSMRNSSYLMLCWHHGAHLWHIICDVTTVLLKYRKYIEKLKLTAKAIHMQITMIYIVCV